MPRYSDKQKVALDALMRDDVHRHALEIIASEGLHGLTLDRLAGRIGVSRATLYNYFADRDAILDFVEERTVAPVLAAVERIVEGDATPPAKLEAIARTIFEAVCDRLILVAALSPEKFSRRGKRSHLRRSERAHELFRRVFQEGVASGDFRDLPPDLASEIFRSTITGLIDNMALRGEFKQPEAIVPTLMTIWLRGMKSGKGARR